MKLFVQKRYNFLEIIEKPHKNWRRRVEVESTTRSAKERVAGFEGREGHRTPFAPIVTITSFQKA